MLGLMRRDIKSQLVFPTERRFIRETSNSGAVSERLLSHNA